VGGRWPIKIFRVKEIGWMMQGSGKKGARIIERIFVSPLHELKVYEHY
jgi:hypothetical protein